jgi:protein-tyrosine phosphatase
MEQSIFKCILNYRDVGETIPQLKPGVLFRAARLDAATESDQFLLRHKYNIQTIIDLRSSVDHVIAMGSWLAIIPPDTITAPKIPGINYVNIGLYGKAFERALVWKMTWTNIAKLVGYMAAGYLTEGISVVGRNVMLPRGLIGLGLDTLQYSGREIREIVNVLTDERSYPVVVHCNQGKDRTGIIILLILVLCGIDLKTVTADYIKSEAELKPEMEELSRYLGRLGLDGSFAGCPADFVDKVVAHIDLEYGGIASYFCSIGVDEATQRKVKQILMVEPVTATADM